MLLCYLQGIVKKYLTPPEKLQLKGNRHDILYDLLH